MCENENLKPSGATSSDVPAGGGTTAGAAPSFTLEAYVSSEHTLEENISSALLMAERLESLVIGNHPRDVLTLETTALSIALRQIRSRYRDEVTKFCL